MSNNPQSAQESTELAVERKRPAMYMIWSHRRAAPLVPELSPGYKLRAVVSQQIEIAREVIEIDGVLTDQQWKDFSDRVLPDGLFFIEEPESSRLVGTVSAIHNPAATRFYFPGGGELGYLVVAPEHRNRRLGGALIGAAVVRFLQAGYHNIFLGVQGWRIPAIRCYLRAGFQPFIHDPDLALRWRTIFQTLGLETNESSWPTRLTQRGTR